jgi:hypothetical protein
MIQAMHWKWRSVLSIGQSSNPEVTETFAHIQITTLSTEMNPARLENSIINTFQLRGKKYFFRFHNIFDKTSIFEKTNIFVDLNQN